MKEITRKARVPMRKIEWLQKRGRMIFLDRVETRSKLWFKGANEDSDYWTKRDVIEVRTLMREHLGEKGGDINAVLVGLDRRKEKNGGKTSEKEQKVIQTSGDDTDGIDDCVAGEQKLKIFGWVQKNKMTAGGEVEWQYARNAEGDEDDTTVDMTDALFQEHHPSVVPEIEHKRKKTQYDRFRGKVPLEIITVSSRYKRAQRPALF